MQSNFQASCSAARDAVAVPPIPLGAIRRAAHARALIRPGRRRRMLVAAAVASLSAVAAAAAATGYFGHVQVSLNPSGAVHVATDDAPSVYKAVIRNPQAHDFEKAARSMNFPVVLPTGLPQGTEPKALMVFGPGAMQIIYDLPGAWRRSNHLLVIMLANPQSVVTGAAKPAHSKHSLQFGPTAGTGGARWRMGQEEVIVLKSTITPAELAHVKAAMAAQVP